MDKKKIEIIAVAVLVVVFFYIWAGTLTKFKPSRRGQAAAPLQAPLPNQALFAAKTTSAVKQKTEGTGWGRDPFTLQETAPQDTDTIANLKLMGIISTSSAKKKGKAIINNDMVKVGTMVGKFKIVTITKKTIIVTDGKENYTLKME